MNTFAQIIPIARYKKVAYYSVSLNGNETSLFEDFVSCFKITEQEKLNHILIWIELIGDKYGATPNFFRSEAATADAAALPPNGMERKPHYTEAGSTKANNLRLYCLRANPHVVFLFNGGIKTKNKAQDCPNVRTPFKLANQLTKAIDAAFIEKDILWINNFTSISVSNDFKLFL